MEKIIGTTELQRNFREVVDEIAEGGQPYIVTRGGRAEAVLVPYEEYTRLKAAAERDVVYEIDQVLNRMRRRHSDLTEDEVAADVARARAELRRRE